MTDAEGFERRAEWLRQEMLRRQPSSSRFHPGDEDLAAYAEGGLAEERRAEVQEHLLTCEECGRLVLDLTAALAEPEPGLSAQEIDESWQRFRPRLAAAARPQGAVAAPPIAPAATFVKPEKRRWTDDRWRALAAALVVAFLGSGLLNVWQWKKGEAGAARVISRTYTLRPTRGAADTLEEKSGHSDLLLKIDVSDDYAGPQPGFVELRRDGGLAWSGEAGFEAPYLLASIPESRLRPGRYEVVVLPGKGGGEPLTRYPLDIAPLSSP